VSLLLLFQADTSTDTVGNCTADYSAWSATCVAQGSAVVTGTASYSAWSATGFDVAPASNMTSWHGCQGATLLQ
jgi:hypothetical protein